MTKGELAASYFLKGYSCAQAIVLSFKEYINIDQNTLLKIASPFGGGVGRLREMCGALNGVYIVLGYLYGDSSNSPINKNDLYKYVQEIAKKFKEVNGFIRCRDLLSLKVEHDSPTPSIRNKEYYKNRPCKNIISSAANILDEFIKNHNFNF